jgi:hypothetical protein
MIATVAFKSRTKFSVQFVRYSSTTFRNLSAVTVQLKAGKCLKTKERISGLKLQRDNRGEAFFYAFDLLWLDGRDLRPLPLVDRMAQLERIVPADSRLLYVRHLEADGTGLFAAVCRNDLEGIFGKWKHGPYLDGRDRNTTWVKVLNPGYSQRTGRAELFKKRFATAGSGLGP